MALIYAMDGRMDGMIGLFAGGVFIGPATYLGFWLSVSTGRAGLAERYRGLPEPGVFVKADAAGLSIGERAAAWPDIALAAMRFRTDVDGEYILERLKLARAFEGVDLDGAVLRAVSPMMRSAAQRSAVAVHDLTAPQTT